MASPRSSSIPPILLEGDEPSGEPESTEGWSTTEGGSRCAYEAGRLMPESGATQRLWLLAVDPSTFYAHWDLSQERLEALRSDAVNRHLELRVYRLRPTGPDDPTGPAKRPSPELKEELPVPCPSRYRFFAPDETGGARGEEQLMAELGYYLSSGKWCPVAVSDPVTRPTESDPREGEYRKATIRPVLPREEARERATHAHEGEEPLPPSDVAFPRPLGSGQRGVGSSARRGEPALPGPPIDRGDVQSRALARSCLAGGAPPGSWQSIRGWAEASRAPGSL